MGLRTARRKNRGGAYSPLNIGFSPAKCSQFPKSVGILTPEEGLPYQRSFM